MDSRLVQPNRNYTSLLCYQKALVIYDMTYHFCERFLDKRDRTYDQMLQAARSGKQNIVEGTVDKSSSYEMMIKLLNVSRGSHMELLEDFHDYLRVRKLRLWEAASKEVAAMRRLGTEHSESDFFINLAVTRSDETIANMMYTNTSGCGGIGRRAGFRFQWATVQVQVLLPVPKFQEPRVLGIFTFC